MTVGMGKGPQDRRVVAITGAAGVGIGAAVAKRLASEGYDVVVTDAHEGRCRKLATDLASLHDRPFRSYVLDVADPSAVEAVFAEVGRIDVVINNAGWSRIEPVAEMSLETWHRCIGVDLSGTFYCMRYALPGMISQRSGVIVNISSIAAWEVSADHGAAYSAAKAGVLALTRVAAAENGRYGIRVNAIAPGLIYNEFLRRIYPADFFDDYADTRSLVGRVGSPEDVAALVSFLVSDEASYITGETYGISGGVSPHV